MRNQTKFLAHLDRVDAACVAVGMPAISPWWREHITEFYRTGVRRFVVRKGRRAGASTIIAPRIAVAEMLFGEHEHTPGAPPLVFAFLSVIKGEATNRLKGVRLVLEALGISYAQKGYYGLEVGNAIFKIVTANYRTAVGETIAWAWIDELARWHDDPQNATPATEVIASLTPALVTLPNATLWLISTPLSNVDYHARCVDAGTNESQYVAVGASWEINPELTEAGTQRDEPDPKIWIREYGAVPSGEISSAFDESTISPCFDPKRTATFFKGGQACFVDPSALKSDAFSVAFGGWAHEDSLPDNARTFKLDGITAFSKGSSISEIVDFIAKGCRDRNIGVVYSDQYEQASFGELLKRKGLRHTVVSYAGGRKRAGVEQLRRMMIEGSLLLPNSPELKRELILYQETFTRSGSLRYAGRGSSKDDHVACLIAAALADLDGKLMFSPKRDRSLGQESRAINNMGMLTDAWLRVESGQVSGGSWGGPSQSSFEHAAPDPHTGPVGPPPILIEADLLAAQGERPGWDDSEPREG